MTDVYKSRVTIYSHRYMITPCMNIGYGSISIYDSRRHDLFFDNATQNAFFIAFERKYDIKLNDEHIKHIKHNKKLWITLTRLPPSKINHATKFEPTYEIV